MSSYVSHLIGSSRANALQSGMKMRWMPSRKPKWWVKRIVYRDAELGYVRPRTRKGCLRLLRRCNLAGQSRLAMTSAGSTAEQWLMGASHVRQIYGHLSHCQCGDV